MQKIIIAAAYRILSIKTQSFFVLTISICVKTISIILIGSLFYQQSVSTSQSVLLLNKVGNLVYCNFQYQNGFQSEHVLAIYGITICEFLYLYLVFKIKLKKSQQKIFIILHQLKSSLSLIVTSVLVNSLLLGLNTHSTILKILSFVCLIISIISQYYTDFLNFTCLFENTDISCRFYDPVGPKIRLLVRLSLIYILIRGNITYQQSIIISSFYVILHIYIIWNAVQYKIIWSSSINEKLNFFSCTLIICFYFTKLFDVVANNKELFLATCVFWSFLAFYSILHFQKNKLLLQPIQKIETSSKSLGYIRLLYKIYKSKQKNDSSLFLLGLIKNHVNDCKNNQCTCHQLRKSNLNLLKDQQFFVNFIQMNLKTLKNKFNSKTMFIAYLAFQVQIMKRYPMYFYQQNILHKFSLSQQLSLAEKFALYQIKRDALIQIEKKKTSKTTTRVQSEQVFKSEDIIKKSYIKIDNIEQGLAKMYQFNARKLCSLSQLRQQLKQIYNLLIQITSQFQSENCNKKITSKQLSLLILFFFRCVFDNPFKSRPLLQRLQIIYKRNRLKDISKQSFDFNLCNQKGCVIQSIVQTNSLGLINKISVNGPNIFGYPSVQYMINLDVNLLLPNCIRNQHQKMMEKWVSSGSFSKINKLQEIFCCNLQQQLFKVLMRSQVTVIDDKIVIFIGIIKIDNQNFMIVDKNGKIDSFGQEFAHVLDKSRRFTSADKLFANWKNIHSRISRQSITVTTPLIKLQTNQQLQLRKTEISQQLDSCFDQATKQFLLNNSTGLTITIQIHISSMFTEQYIVIKKLNISKNSKQIDYQCAEHQWNKNLKQGMSTIKLKYTDNYDKDNQKDHEIDIDEEQVQIKCESSTSSLNQNRFCVHKMIHKVMSKAMTKSSQVHYPLLSYVTAVLILIFITMKLTIFVQVYLQSRGIDSFNQVIYADSAVSDNMQLLQITYNNIMLFDQHCNRNINKTTNMCSSLIKSLNTIQDTLTQLLALDIQDLIKNQTFFGHKYFVYETFQVKMSINSTVISVRIFQFMEYFIRNSKLLFRSIKENYLDSNIYDNILKDMKANWPQMKRINIGNLQYYESVGNIELQKCAFLLFLTSSLFGVLSTLFMAAKLLFHYQSYVLLNKILCLFRKIPSGISQKFSEYYQNSRNNLKKSKIAKQQKIELPQFKQGIILSQYGFQPHKSYSQSIKTTSIWVLLIVVCCFSTYQMIKYNDFQRNSIQTIGQLMNSQNIMLQNYFQIKSNYLFSSIQSPSQTQTMGMNIIKLDIQQNMFNQIGLDISDSISKLDITQANEFSGVLIQNICELIKDHATQQQYHDCINNVHYKLMQQGILSAMTLFQNMILQTIYKLQLPSPDVKQIFKQKTLQDLDRYMIFMFKVYQQTQAKVIQGLTIIASAKFSVIFIIISLQLSIIVSIMFLWMFYFNTKKKEYSQNYGYLLAIPLCLVEQSKYLQQSIQKLL